MSKYTLYAKKILFFITSAFAALHVRLQLPALVAGALDAGLLLLAPLATLEVFGTEALDMAGLVVSSQFHTQGTRAHEALPRNDAAIVATATVVQCTQVYRQEIETELNALFVVFFSMKGTGQMNQVLNTFSCCLLCQNVFVCKEYFTTKFLVRAIRTIVSAITQLLGRKTDGVVGSTHVVRQLAHQRLAVVLIRVVLTVTVAITHPSLADAASCPDHKISIFSFCCLKICTFMIHS